MVLHHPLYTHSTVAGPRRIMANGVLVLGGMGLLAVALVSVSLHKIEEGIKQECLVLLSMY